MKHTFTFLVTFSLLFFSCSDDDIVATYELNDFEHSIFPAFDEETELQFSTNQGVSVVATVSPKEVSMNKNEVDGDLVNIEGAYSTFTINDLILRVYIVKVPQSPRLGLMATKNGSIEEDVDVYGVTTCGSGPFIENLETQLTDITLHGNTYTNVFVFNECYLGEGNTNIDKIVYSTERSIELIAFKDGTYLKQN